jgi:hypothetical protein
MMTGIIKIRTANGLPTSQERSEGWIHPLITED